MLVLVGGVRCSWRAFVVVVTEYPETLTEEIEVCCDDRVGVRSRS